MKFIYKLLALLSLLLLFSFCLVGCNVSDNNSPLKGTEVRSETLSVSLTDKTINAKLPNGTESFHIANYISVADKATYSLFFDITGQVEIPTKSVSLSEGDNIFYLVVNNANEYTTYTINLRVRPIYTITFNSNGGSNIETQYIEEDSFVKEPQKPEKQGCSFAGWDYDFSKPILKNQTINASWNSLGVFNYRVNYYLENFNNNDYTLTDTIQLSGLAGDIVNAEIKSFDNYTFNKSLSLDNGIVTEDGNLTLYLYYTLNRFSLCNVNSEYGHITNAGIYKYDNNTITSVATEYLGCEFIGWYENNILVTTERTFQYIADKNVEAKFRVKVEMENFIFNSNETYCAVTGILNKFKDKIIVPNYVTSISKGAFNGCIAKEITIPFIGASKNASNGYDQVFGYIFGYTTEYSNPSKYPPSGIFQYYDSSNPSGRNCYWYKIPSSIKTVNVSGGSIPYRAFYNCIYIEKIKLPTEATYIGNDAFYDCHNLHDIEIPNNVVSIGSWAFYNCDLFNSIIIPKSVELIGGGLFNGCDRLHSITFNVGISNISSSIFAGCPFITSVNFIGSKTQWLEITKDLNWNYNVICEDGEIIYS